jgi:hypothetical protein
MKSEAVLMLTSFSLSMAPGIYSTLDLDDVGYRKPTKSLVGGWDHGSHLEGK